MNEKPVGVTLWEIILLVFIGPWLITILITLLIIFVVNYF